MKPKVAWIKLHERDENGNTNKVDSTYYHEIVFKEPDDYELNLYQKVTIIPLED